MSGVLLKFNQLKKQFGYHRAVNSASGEICENEFISLYGVNGAGKSTLLYLLSGVYKPDSGSIDYLNLGKKNFHLKMQLMSHQSMFYARLSAYDNLFFFQELYGEARISEVLFALEMTGLIKARSKFIDGFSRGMIQRLMIARMILAKPEFVFFDEPFTGLDIQGQKLLLSIIENRGIPALHWKIKSFIFVDHDIDRAYELTSTVWYIQNGELQKPMTKNEMPLDQLRELLG
ncbi:MAG: ABC transporter ATP-binding protein [Spirochaetia bacterium]|nr:ABC transporter ATP-binding protein [Spirochaetia bacterium]